MPDIVPQVVALVLLVVSGFFTIRELALYLKERNRKSLGSPPPPPKSNPQLEEENKRLRQELVAVQTDLQWAKKRIEQLERGLERSIGPQEVEEMRREIRELKIQNEELRTENAALKERIRPLQEKADHANVLKKLYHDIKFERRKSNVSEFETFVKSKNIVCLYHVTERENLPNIQKYGLLSWKFIEEMKLFVPAYVSDDISRNLDKRSKLEDYVRLSFTRSIPMMHQKIAEGKAVDLVVLCIDKQVLFWEDTLFSDRN
ncbi:MAG: DarT ssDNA thymidine ADP-ribosyltransferase family protein, partial [Bacteroidia bacterium]|nr:DarT ssDNA thymidine ADP-ribosyltransferase family protein [Bacteroidia bacterium]